MNKLFKTVRQLPVDLISYCCDFTTRYPGTKIFIGTDSQNKGDVTRYVTVIAFRYENKGAHVIYTSKKVPRVKDTFTRLFNECELSLELANWLQANTSLKVDCIELDYNSKKVTKSSPLVASTKGWCESLGFRTLVKPSELVAVRAADYFCRN